MDNLIVAGVDSVVGANLAAQLAERFHVAGVSAATPITVDGCETSHLPTADPQAIRQLVASYRPDRIVACGAAGDSIWNASANRIGDPRMMAATLNWAHTARDFNIPFTLISSDAIFTGPWMFHTESSVSFCKSAGAESLRMLENAVLAECPQALVVRTHTYGWSPLSTATGWIEGIIAALEADRPGIFDCMPHATPILATDLAEVVHNAWSAELAGMHHVAGAERTSPYRFARALAGVFQLPTPRAANLTPADGAQGETSLHTRKIRRALGISMPLLVDGLERLRAQQTTGHDRRFRGGRTAASKVA